jgi:glutathione S-transferase
MRLFISPISPYVRKVEIIAYLKGLGDRLEKVKARDVGVDIASLNPLAKVPTFIADDGEVMIESGLICQYLDEIGTGPRLYGDDAKTRRSILQQEALAQGVLDAAVACRMEVREHSPEQQSTAWLERQHKKLEAGLTAIEKNLSNLSFDLGLLHACYVCALYFIDQHKVYESWRQHYPHLAQWYLQMRALPLIASTEPQAGH